MILHHIQTSPTTDNALAICLRYFASNDSIVFAADAIYALLNHSWFESLKSKKIFVLKDDATALGLVDKLACAQHVEITFISYDEFVQQTLLHDKVITW